jgi:hypothetical protein
MLSNRLGNTPIYRAQIIVPPLATAPSDFSNIVVRPPPCYLAMDYCPSRLRNVGVVFPPMNPMYQFSPTSRLIARQSVNVQHHKFLQCFRKYRGTAVLD